MKTCVDALFGCPDLANASVPRSSAKKPGSSMNSRSFHALCGSRQLTPNCATNPGTTREIGVSSKNPERASSVKRCAAFGAACGYTSMTTSPAVVANRMVVTWVNAGTAPSLPGNGVSFASAVLGGALDAGAVAASSLFC